MEEKQDLEAVAFQMIFHSGNARSNLILALRECKAKNFAACDALMEEAEKMLAEAHKTHFGLIQNEASGNKTEFSLLLMHAEDHLMSTSTMKELMKELVDILKTI